jgi:GT2 family glycosyltransferase
MVFPRTIHANLSLVIRTYNEAKFIGRLMNTIASQQGLSRRPELVVVDSGSTDETVKIAQAGGAHLFHVRKEDFDYSRALNYGIENSSGEFIAILSAHSIPCDTNWLSAMLSHFDDPQVAGVFSRQVAWPEAYWWEMRRVRREFSETNATYERANCPGNVPFSNAASCIRRSIWEKHPFQLPTGEDGEWATWAVAQGSRIIYDARVAVYHSHQETCRQAMRRVIEFEKALDLRLGRSRTGALTMRQAVGRTVRDLKDIWGPDNPTGPRLKLAWESVLRGYWFLRDFRPRQQFRSPLRQER